jgi:uncharacterized membrane protein
MNVCVRILAAAALVGSLAAGPARAGGYKFTTVDGPAPNVGGTHLAGINNYGSVAGVTRDAAHDVQGFFGPPRALTPLGLPFSQGFFAPSQAVITSINDYDEVLGYVPVNPRTHYQGFMFEFYDGEFDTFPVPWKLLGAPARSMNDDDVIAGSFFNGPGKVSGYTLDVWNNLTAFDATPWTSWTAAVGINNLGTVVGQYTTGFSPGAATAGFLRDPYGTIALLPTPRWIGGIAVGPGGIYYNGINDGGVTVGSFLDPNNKSYGFVRDAAGNFTLIRFPGASATVGVVGINDDGMIAGNYFDASGVEHGFIATPQTAP